MKGRDAPMRLAVGFGARVRGLLGAKRSKGIVMLAPCNDVHTFGMAELIDIAFLDEQGRVLESYRAVGPRRRIRCRKAVAVLERFSVNDPPWFSAGERVEMTRKDGAGNEGMPSLPRKGVRRCRGLLRLHASVQQQRAGGCADAGQRA